jgi:hypothetical protein
LMAVGLSVVLYPLAPWVLRLWTNNAVPFEPVTMALMLAYAAVAALGHVAKEFLMATTRHARLAQSSLVIAVAGVAFAAALGHAYRLEGTVVALVAAELLLTLVSIVLARRVLAAFPTGDRVA